MGRKFLTSAVVAAAAFGVTAGPALAQAAPSTNFSNGAKMTAKGKQQFSTKMHAAVSAASAAGGSGTGTAQVINHGALAECTVPEGGGNYTNFFTKDTTNYFEIGGFVLVGECSADLNNPQTSATSTDHPGGKKMIPFPGTYNTYTEACNIMYRGQDYYGDAESIVYKDGQFVETCIVPILDA